MQTNNKVKITLGEKLNSARKSAGLTQEQFAEKLLDISIDYLLDSEEKITAEKFEIGNISFIDCGIISELDKDNKNGK